MSLSKGDVMYALETFRYDESTGQDAGELAAFAEALKSHLSGLRAKAARMERTASDADDLVQDTLERALRSWQRFAPGTNLRCWLHTIMHNLFLDRCRSRNRRELATRDAAQEAEDTPPWDADAPEWESVSMVEVQDLSRGLRPALRDAVELVFFCGLNYEQTAERLRFPRPRSEHGCCGRRRLRELIERRHAV